MQLTTPNPATTWRPPTPPAPAADGPTGRGLVALIVGIAVAGILVGFVGGHAYGRDSGLRDQRRVDAEIIATAQRHAADVCGNVLDRNLNPHCTNRGGS